MQIGNRIMGEDHKIYSKTNEEMQMRLDGFGIFVEDIASMIVSSSRELLLFLPRPRNHGDRGPVT